MADSSASDDLIANFCSITGATESQARFFLDSSGGDLDSAISAFYDHGGETTGEQGDSDVAGGVGAGGPRPTVTARGALEGGWNEDEEMGDEVQQRAPLRGYGGQPPRGGASAGAAAGAGRQGGRGGGQKTGGGGSGSRIRTFGDLGRSEEEEEEDEDAQEYYTGGEKSGIAVQDPNARRRGGTAGPGASGLPGLGGGSLNVDNVFERARQQGARQGMEADLVNPADPAAAARGRGGAFSGVGRTLGGAGVEEGAPSPGDAVAAAATGAAGGSAGGGDGGERVVRHTVTFFTNGFTVNDGPLRDLADPINIPFLRSLLERNECPRELAQEDPRVRVEVNLLRRMEEWKPPPVPAYVAFSGQGRTLGAALDSSAQADTTNATVAAPVAVAAAAAPPTGASAGGPSAGLQVDPSLPSTSIQLRLSDGTRLVAHFNLHHTVADIRRFISSARPSASSDSYSLQVMGFPPKKLDDDAASIEAAGLANAVVLQR